MSARRYPTADAYDERSGEFYRSGRRSGREYEELDVDIRSHRNLDFLDDNYGRPTAGALVVQDRPREVEREEIIIDRERAPIAHPRRRARSVEREEVVVRRGERDRFRRDAEREEIDVIIRKEEDSRQPPRRRAREVERDDVSIRRSETDLSGRSREVEREDIVIRHGHGSVRGEGRRPARSVVDHEDDIIIRRSEHEGRGRHHQHEHEEIEVRHRSRSRPRHESLPPPRGMIGRETEEVVIRRRKERTPSPPPPPPPRREVEREEVIIRRRKERTPSPSPPPPSRRELEREEIIIRRTEEREPTPPPPLPEPEPPVMMPIIRPPIHQQIHQEIITHHRHIDHGVERAWSPEPSPPPAPRTPTPPPAPKRVEETIEVDIRRRGQHSDFEEDIKIEHDVRGRTDHETALVHRRSHSAHSGPRHRSASAAPRRRYYDDDLEEEADYYNRRQMERAYVGEAHNGATKDWAIVDVPPGTERVKMDGAGGSSQEVTWQRYNGVRRAKFLAGDREFKTGFGVPERNPSPAPLPLPAPAPRPRPSDMWTEITKDLVIKDAIDAFGYEYEETEYFFYVMEYLRYEDVLQLVQFSDDIRRERRRRLREIEWERESLRRPRYHDHDRHRDRDRYYEHEVILDTRRRH